MTVDNAVCWRNEPEDFHYEFGLFCDFDTFSWTSRIELGRVALRHKVTMEGNLTGPPHVNREYRVRGKL